MNQYLTAKQVAAYLNMSVSSVYTWASLHKLPHIKLNGILRFPEDKIQQWYDEGYVEPRKRNVKPIL